MITSEHRERFEENFETEPLEELAADAKAHPIIDDRPAFGEYEGHYDESPEAGEDGLYGQQLNDGLTDMEMSFASRLSFLCRGVMIVHGRPGCGKGTFGAYMAWKIRRFFGKRVILDYEAKPIFDYGYETNRFKFFTAETMMDEVDRMALKAETTSQPIKRDMETLKGADKEKVDRLSESWAKTRGTVLMKDSVWELDELKRYLHNRHAFNRVGIQIGHILSQWRHLRLLCLGMCPNMEEIDVKGFLQYVTQEVAPLQCTRWKPNTFKCIIRRTAHISNNGVVAFSPKDYPIYVDGGKPRPEIGVELLHDDLPLGAPEKLIVEVLKYKRENTGLALANLNEISDYTGEELNECKMRLLKMHGRYPDGNRLYHKEAPIVCKCVFNLFNSLDYKNLKPGATMRREE